MITLRLLLMIIALVCFFGATIDIKPQRISLLPLGLFFWALAEVLGR